MVIRAENDPRYSRRFLIMGICAVGFALWSLYDGAIRYPAERAQGFEEFRAESKTLAKDPSSKSWSVTDFERLADEDRRLEWNTYAHERGVHSSADVVVQFIMATLAGLVGLLLVSIPLRSRGRWIEASDMGITSSWGESFRFDQVELLNKRKWRDKGIAKVTYRDGNRKRRFVIDDYKFDRHQTDAILYELEQKIGVDKITGGPPETPAEEFAKDSSDAAAATSAAEPS